MRRLPLAIVTLVACAAVAETAPAASTTIAPVQGQNSVRAYAGAQVWTDYNIADTRWHVVVRRGGRISVPPAIPSGDARLTADVGPGPGGAPTLAYVGCTDTCRVVLSDLDGANARTVPGSERARSVSISGSRVAWVRGANTVLVRDLRSGTTKRVPGAPRRKCWIPFAQRGTTSRPTCEATSGKSVYDIDLDGTRIALIVGYGVQHGGGSNGTTEVRMESVGGGPQRLLALMNVGEGQQTWIGPSWAKHDLFFYRSCPFACPRAQGTYRYDPARRVFAHAPAARAVSGFAMDADAVHAFVVLGLFGGREDSVDFATTLQRTPRLAFARSRPPVAAIG